MDEELFTMFYPSKAQGNRLTRYVPQREVEEIEQVTVDKLKQVLQRVETKCADVNAASSSPPATVASSPCPDGRSVPASSSTPSATNTSWQELRSAHC
ncbi:hypothetical protein AALO_G00092580 [Alosa alosa]|uniref:Uncharacterized protein n=1 Tax=Alosa alosa TaxID=278164 RepID=A0AAV6GVZ6_9TELE|nr:hypothetical protein AALO_G00092580 [Alosa alosa]